MKKFRFSIITINYNNLEGLKKTFNSVIGQTFRGLQYIIIDGGSTDGSREFIANNCHNIDFWLSEPDDGIYHAMNKGINLANGNFCLFLNSGDVLYDKETLRNCNEEIKKYGNLRSKNCIFIGSTQNEQTKLVFSPPRVFSLFHFYHDSIPHQGEFIPLELLKNSPYSMNYKSISDWSKNIEFLLDGVQFVTFKAPKIISITENEGISGTDINFIERKNFIKKNIHLFYNFENLLDFEDKKQLYQFRYFNEVINSNLLNKILWKLMRKIKFDGKCLKMF
jgi:glycosyltransferase involved in cell wall biosynthesis